MLLLSVMFRLTHLFIIICPVIIVSLLPVITIAVNVTILNKPNLHVFKMFKINYEEESYQVVSI